MNEITTNISPTDTVEAVQLNLDNVNVIFTHDGIFHADDVFATAIVLLAMAKGKFKDLFVFLNNPMGDITVAVGTKIVTIVRDRNFLYQGDRELVLDVGGRYNPHNMEFDHHQNGFDEKWPCGTLMAASGLVYCHFNNVFQFPNKVALREMIKNIDARDNGRMDRAYTPSQCVASFLPVWKEEGDTTRTEINNAFSAALNWVLEYISLVVSDCMFKEEQIMVHMGQVISNSQKMAVAEMKIEEILEEKISASTHVFKPVLELERFIPWVRSKAIKNSSKELKFVIFPSLNEGEWCCQTISDWTRVPGGPSVLITRCEFPPTWAALTGEELQRESMIPTAKFCHRNRFLFVATSKEGAFEAAAEAIQYQDDVNMNGVFMDDIKNEIAKGFDMPPVGL